MPLYSIQDADRPMYVVAHNWQDALSKWQKVIEEENPGYHDEQPNGIKYVCSDHELIADRINAA